MSMPKRGLPSSLDSELAVLGAMLMGSIAPSAEIARHIQADDFFDPVHGRIFAAAVEVLGEGRAPDAILVGERMKRDAGLEALGGAEYLVDLVVAGASASSAADYARLVADLAARRRAIAAIDQVRGELFEPRSSVIDAMSSLALMAAETAAKRENGSGFKSMQELTREALDQAFRAARGETEPAWSTGLADIDRMFMGGFRPTEMIAVSGRPSMGKTAMLRTIAAGLARGRQNVGAENDVVLFISLEMGREKLAQRQLACDGRTWDGPAYSEIGAARPSLAALERLRDAPDLAPHNLRVKQAGGLTLARARAAALSEHVRAQGRGGRLCAVVIDYLQLMRSAAKIEARWQAIGEISRGLKQLAIDLNCAVIIGAQLGRQVESRDDKRPRMYDLRESGDIEQDIDVHMGLYRPEYYLEREGRPDQPGDDQMEFDLAMAKARNKLVAIIDKNRSGAIGDVELYADMAHDAIENLAREAA